MFSHGFHHFFLIHSWFFHNELLIHWSIQFFDYGTTITELVMDTYEFSIVWYYNPITTIQFLQSSTTSISFWDK